jgi:ankyrin repeat protein
MASAAVCCYGDVSLPIHLAVSYGASLEVVEFLVDQCPRALKERTSTGALPLHLAAAFAPLQVVQVLSDQALKERDADVWLPLHVAAVFVAPLQVVQFILDRYPQALSKADDCGLLPLHVAAKASELEVVKLLADRRPRALRTPEASRCTARPAASRLRTWSSS